MDTIKVNKQTLLEIMEKNRNTHKQEVDEAFKGYHEAVLNKLNNILTNVSNAKDGRNLDLAISLTKPQDYTKTYDKIIGMLKLSNEDVIELDQQEYTQYVEDEWNWSSVAKATNSYYASNR